MEATCLLASVSWVNTGFVWEEKNTVNLKPNVAADLNDVLKLNFKKSVKKDKSLSNELL